MITGTAKSSAPFSLVWACTFAALAALSSAAVAGNSVGEKAVTNQSCQGRALVSPGADGKFDPLVLLDGAMKGKSFDYNPAASLAGTEAMLVQYFGLRQSLRSLPVEQDRQAVGRIASLMQNGNVVAGQMALGALRPKNNLPREMMQVLDTYVTNITEPFHGDNELTVIDEQVRKAIEMTATMSPQPRAFARWAMKAAAFEDGVAHDAAMRGFCSAKPTSADTALLLKALKVAKLDRSRDYKDPAVSTGAEPMPALPLKR